jgi:inorganic pyrophosphatase
MKARLLQRRVEMGQRNRCLLFLLLVPCVVAAQQIAGPPPVLPASASAVLVSSLKAAEGHTKHVWRDTAPTNTDGTVNGYIEIPRGDRRKWEFAMGRNARAIDRVMPEDLGGYPVNYGFVPQTVSYDGDPFDILVLGPPLGGGALVRGVVVGLMAMEDEKGLDSKVVVSLTDKNGRAQHHLTQEDQQRIGDYFRRYKLHEPGKFSKVPGWGTAADGLAFVRTTHAFFTKCRTVPARECTVAVPGITVR